MATAEANGPVKLELVPELVSELLTSDEMEILDKELDMPTINATYWMLFRYSTRLDIALYLVSGGLACVAGACLPLMPVGSLSQSFSCLG